MEIFQDYYDALDAKVVYISENIPSRDTYDLFYEISIGCKCEDRCTIENGCSCLQTNSNYKFDPNNTPSIKTLETVQNNYVLTKKDNPVYECNPNCKCSTFCGNRLVQYGPRKNLRIVPELELTILNLLRIDQNKGAGLVTNTPIRNGNFICEYAGEVISKEEADKRYESQEERQLPNYIFCVTEQFGENKIQTYIDPAYFGNIGRYVNHSCSPNCEVIPVRCHSSIPKLCIFAIKDILANAEITFDYGDGKLGYWGSDIDLTKKECYCKSNSCRKFLPFHK